MLAALFLFALIALLIVLARFLYSGDRPAGPSAEKPDPRIERLATLLPPDLMASLEERSRQTDCRVMDLLESLIEEGLERGRGEDGPASPG